MKPKASKRRNMFTDKYPSFDTTDQLIAFAKAMGATHIQISNYHGGAFFKTVKGKWFTEVLVMRFHDRYDYNNGRISPLEYNIGWYIDGQWSRHPQLDLRENYGTYPLFSLDTDNPKAAILLENLRICHDANRDYHEETNLLRKV